MLPANADMEQASLHSVDGIVTVSVPKKETEAEDQKEADKDFLPTETKMAMLEMRSDTSSEDSSSSESSSEHGDHLGRKDKDGCRKDKGKDGKGGGRGPGLLGRHGICKG